MSHEECGGHSLLPHCNCVPLPGTGVRVDKIYQARMIFDKRKSQKCLHCALECLNLPLPPAPLNTSSITNPSQEHQTDSGELFWKVLSLCDTVRMMAALLSCNAGDGSGSLCVCKGWIWLHEPLGLAVAIKCALLEWASLPLQRCVGGSGAGSDLSFRCWRIVLCP